MALRTWIRLVFAALAIGLLAGAGQLGLAYGLGIVHFARAFSGGTANHWYAQLAWVTWFAMVAAVVGAVATDRLARRRGHPATTGSALVVASAGALGALVVAPLSMQPARAAEVTAVAPALAVGWSAVFGAVVGFLAALVALRAPLAGGNILAVTGVSWLFAVLSVLPSLAPSDPLPAARLGVPDPTGLAATTAQRLAVVALPTLALVAGAVTGAYARWRHRSVLAAVTAGSAGPALPALAYLAAGPGGYTDRYQAAPYWGALIAVAAGAAGCLLAALTGRSGGSRPGDETVQPTEILSPDGRPVELPGTTPVEAPAEAPSRAAPTTNVRAGGTDGKDGSEQRVQGGEIIR